ncbi:MAG: TIGR03936 family radical SAM-associated protein [Candidatus Omnitrophica bacterium]|nr:TIGR03936 family radical SAM-associated protein [Candidatus Omnitrophota bacterium]MDD5573788.1 TIGR03936 family radical SAM-associated protein [Candidatus Omnitrophota bacterium]
MGQEKFKYLFEFGKGGRSIFISHLDLLRLFGRAARRADLPVALTEGFHPHLKIKLHQAVKLGVEAQRETGEIILKERRQEDEIRQRWQKELPAGVVIHGVKFLRDLSVK